MQPGLHQAATIQKNEEDHLSQGAVNTGTKNHRCELRQCHLDIGNQNLTKRSSPCCKYMYTFQA